MMPETRKGAKLKEESEAPPGHVAGESPEMAAIRLLHASFTREQQRADDRRADAERRRVIAEQEAADRQAAADQARRDHELKMAALYADIAAKLGAQGPPVAPVGAAAGPPGGGGAGPGVTEVKAFDIRQLDPIPAGAKFREFRLWRDAWEANGKCHKLHLFAREEQVYAFLQAVGVHAANVLKVHCRMEPGDDATTVAAMLAALQRYFRANQSITVDGVRFTERFQQPGERFDEFWFAVNELAKDAELCGQCEDRRLREQLVRGMRDQDAKKELLRHKALTLEVVVDVARAYEAAIADSTGGLAGRDGGGGAHEVDVVRSAYKERQRDEVAARAAATPVAPAAGPPAVRAKCGFCTKREHARSVCPARDATCHGCGQKGHWRPRCPRENRGNLPRTGPNRMPVGVAPGRCDSVIGAARGSAAVVLPGLLPAALDEKGFCRQRCVTVRFFGVDGADLGELRVLPDTGATASLMSRRDFSQLRGDLGDITPLDRALTTANGQGIEVDGTASFVVQFRGRRVLVPFTITEAYAGTLLCCEVCEVLGAVEFLGPAEKVPAVQAVALEEGDPSPAELDAWRAGILEEFAAVFDDEEEPLRAMKGEPMVIALREDAVPTRITCPRPVPLPMREAAKKLLDDLESRGVIKRVTDPTDWVHPLTFVRKPIGKLRLCVDLRGLNKFVDRPLHPFRAPKEVVAVVPPTSRFFSTFDASSGYFQVPLAEESQLLTTFLTQWGRYAHTRATMGLSSSSDEYNRRGDAAMEGLSSISKIVDDVLVFDDTFAGHKKAVRAFLERCRDHCITLNRKKTTLGQSQVKFAGYMVGHDGVAADPAKLRALRDFPRPMTITDLRSFLGLVEQLAGFSRDVAAAMVPLRPLLSSKSQFL